ncbi:hypothetical protein HA052_22985 [Chromobacterium haemolyticum]|uniref:Uncharacterized protein n=1 Tax=Chromobacterium fluminis TaxID=3044269 RepID=A0ABX0LB99_9NEIS|nr:hypothetical protein [Chromobacterium haemolyticum]NHR08060.1 hypothetical protein [Chromobacterium haemolyticum]
MDAKKIIDWAAWIIVLIPAPIGAYINVRDNGFSLANAGWGALGAVLVSSFSIVAIAGFFFLIYKIFRPSN